MSGISKFAVRFARCTSGSALLEAIIVLPLAIILMIGIVDFAWALSMQATASKSMRDAARYLASLPAGAACSDWAAANAKNLAVYGKFSVATGDPPLVPGWQTDGTNSNVTVTIDCPTPTVIQVSATIPLTSLIVASIVPIPQTLTLSAQHLERPAPLVGDSSG